MKGLIKLSILGAAFVTLASTSAFATTACSGTTGQDSFSGFTCEQGDKIFSNFSSSDTNLIVSFNGSGLGAYNVVFQNGDGTSLTTNFTVSFTVAVDPSSNDHISSLGAGLLDSGGTAMANVTNSVAGCSAGTPSATDPGTGSSLTFQNCTGLNATTLDITLSYAKTGGTNTVNSVSDAIFQTANVVTPEPTTFVLMGAGLGLLGMLRRKTSRR